MRINYEIKLLSPSITANSGTIGKDLDITLKRDSQGKPYFPGKHIKGILRSRTEEFLNALGEDAPKFLKEVFGEEGNGISKIRFSDLKLNKEFYDRKNTGSRYGIRVNRKTRTASNASLFSYEHINKEHIFEGFIDAQDLNTESLKRVLAALFKLHSVGGLKSRGMGKVKVLIEGKNEKELDFLLKELEKKSVKPSGSFKGGNFKKYNFTLESLENLILKDKEIGNNISVRDSLQGSTVRGAVIQKLLGAGIPAEEITKISASDAMPEGRELPVASVFRSKYPSGGKTKRVDKLFFDGMEIDGIKLERDSLDILKSKGNDIGIEIDSRTRTAKNGKIYNMEILQAENLVFHGELIIPESAEKIINGKEILLGKSKSKGFGRCTLKLSPYKAPETKSLKKRIEEFDRRNQNLVSFTLVSDLVLPFREIFNLALQFRELTGINLEPWEEKSFINADILRGYNIVNNMRKGDELIIKKGSVISFKGKGMEILPQLEKIERDGLGLRRKEGFGRVEVCSVRHLEGDR